MILGKFPFTESQLNCFFWVLGDLKNSMIRWFIEIGLEVRTCFKIIRKTSWCFQIFFIFTPIPGEIFQIRLIFFGWVETTNQKNDVKKIVPIVGGECFHEWFQMFEHLFRECSQLTLISGRFGFDEDSSKGVETTNYS